MMIELDAVLLCERGLRDKSDAEAMKKTKNEQLDDSFHPRSHKL